MAASRSLELQSLLGLYRSILRMHRLQLPGEVRQLGDAHVRSEFRSHLKSQNVTRQQWEEFVLQWRGYLGILQPRQNGQQLQFDNDMSVDALQQMSEGLQGYLSPEQRLRMGALQKEAQQLGHSMLGKQSPAEETVQKLKLDS